LQEPIAGAQQSAPDSDEVASEPAFRPEWLALFADPSNNRVNHADERVAKHASVAASTTNDTHVVQFGLVAIDRWTLAAPWSDSWPAHIDQYATVDGLSADGSLWQFYERLDAVHVAEATPTLDDTDGAAASGHNDDAEPGSTPGGADLNAHAARPVGSSTPPSIIMEISMLVTTGGGEGLNEVASVASQLWAAPGGSGIETIPTLFSTADSALTTSFLSSTFHNPFGDFLAAAAFPTIAAAHAQPNHAPVVWINHPFSPTGEWSHVGDWVSYSDADGDPAVQYQFRDDGLAPNSAYLSTPSNAHVPDGTTLTVAVTDLTNVLVHSGDPNTSDTMWVRASDGSDWSAWVPIDFATTASGQAYGVVDTVPVVVAVGGGGAGGAGGFVGGGVIAIEPLPAPPAVPAILASPGPDTFVFNQNSTGTTIVDFDPSQDTIQFVGTSLADFASVVSHTTDDGRGNAVIAYDAHNAVTLIGVTPAMLHPSDFHIL
jgi:hypothetical protein